MVFLLRIDKRTIYCLAKAASLGASLLTIDVPRHWERQTLSAKCLVEPGTRELLLVAIVSACRHKHSRNKPYTGKKILPERGIRPRNDHVLKFGRNRFPGIPPVEEEPQLSSFELDGFDYFLLCGRIYVKTTQAIGKFNGQRLKCLELPP